MQHITRNILPLLVILSFTLSSYSQESSFSHAGSKWLGLGGKFNAYRAIDSDGSVRNTELETVSRFYPTNNLFVGPKFGFSRYSEGEFGDRYYMTLYDLGMDLGFSGNIDNRFMPYFILNPSLALLTARYEGDGDSEPTFKGVVRAGCLFFANDVIGFQAEPVYTIYPEEEMYTLGFNFGFVANFGKNILSLSTSSLSLSDLFMM